MDYGKLFDGKSGWIRVPFQNEELKVRYRPGLMTPAYLQNIINNDGDVGAIASLVADLITDWDLVNDGEPIEPSLEICLQLPVALLNTIIRTCNEDMSGGKSANPSSNFGNGSMARGRGKVAP